MTPKEEIQAELTAVASVIENARAALSRNEIVEIRDVPGRMRDVANAITDLAPEDATEMRSPLLELLTDFKAFAEELKSKIEEIEADDGAEGETARNGRSEG